MQIRVEQLRADLKTRQLPVYMVCGEEPLQHRESVDMLRKAAHYYGYEEREVYTAEAGFDWNTLSQAANELSLFSSKRLIEIHMPSGKPADKGKAIIEYCEHLPEDIWLLLITGKLESATRKSKWYQALDQLAGIITAWPLEGQPLKHWLSRRLYQKGLNLQPESIDLLSERIEGNLLAADQEIEKLSLLYPVSGQEQVDLSCEQVSDAVFDSARYNVFELFDCALSGDLKRAVKMLHGLESEGESVILIQTLIAKEVRMLAKMSVVFERTSDIQKAVKGFYIFPKRKSLVVQALHQSQPKDWQNLLQALASADKVAKGLLPGNPWDSMQLILAQLGRKAFLTTDELI
jgi:DNA polymerase-3 subunit delta